MTFCSHRTYRTDCQLLWPFLHVYLKRGGIIFWFDDCEGEGGDPWCVSATLFDKTVHCQSWLTNHAEEWHQVSESHNWPRACRRTHSNGKHQMSSKWEDARERLWPTWHYHTNGYWCPERNLQEADRPNRQQCYGYFPWQPVESTGSSEWCGEEKKKVIFWLLLFLSFFWKRVPIKCFLERYCHISSSSVQIKENYFASLLIVVFFLL